MRVVRALVGAAVMLVCLSTGHASLTGTFTGHLVSYQFDGSSHHDAPDGCAEADLDWSFAVGSDTDGMLVAGDDGTDVFLFHVAQSQVGSRLRVTVREAMASPDVDLAVVAPGCDGSVFELHNLPVPFPMPPTPLQGQQQVDVGAIDGSWDCNAREWRFALHQIHGASPPATIHVAWTDGTEVTVNLTAANNGIAKYDYGGKLAVLPTNAWANIDNTWNGTFSIAFGPCTAQDGGAVYGDPPEMGDDVIRFTPIQAGLHVAVLTLAPPQAPGPGLAIPASCHFCGPPAVEQSYAHASYRVGAWVEA